MTIELLTRPRLKRHLRAEVIERDRTVIFGEGKQSLLKGEVHARLIPLLDGARSTDEIVDELIDDLPATDIYYALLTLQKRGDVEEAEESLPSEVAAYWSALGHDARDAALRLDTAGVLQSRRDPSRGWQGGRRAVARGARERRRWRHLPVHREHRVHDSLLRLLGVDGIDVVPVEHASAARST